MRMLMRSAKCSLTTAVAALATIFLTGAGAADSLRIEGGQIADAVPDASGIRVFKGIPYAAPPVGELRWKAPQPVQPWNGIRSIAEWGHTPISGKRKVRLCFLVRGQCHEYHNDSSPHACGERACGRHRMARVVGTQILTEDVPRRSMAT